MTDEERMQRTPILIATIRKNLPDFAKACADETELVLLHQDAFAADYQQDEFTLLGMAIKYAGLREKATASFTLPFDTREVWGKAKVPVKVTINGYTWSSTVGNRGGIQYIVVNADARL